MTRPPELRELASQLRANGMLHKEIADTLGVPKPTVSRWLNPELEQRGRAHARKRKYQTRKRCVDCGGRITTTAHARCLACHHKHVDTNRRWTRENVIQAIQTWAAKHGKPPSMDDWRHATPHHPQADTLYKNSRNPVFSSWREAIETAGFKTRHRTRYTPESKLTPKQRAAIRRQHREAKLKRALAKERNP